MLRKVQPGQPLLHSAAHHNAVVDMEHARRFPPPAEARRPSVAQFGAFLVRNNSGADLTELSVLGIGDPLYPAGTNRYKYLPSFAGVTATAAHAGKFCVVQGPAPDGRLKLAVFAGVTSVQVTIGDQAHTFADVDPDNPTVLQTVDCGSAKILHRDSGSVGEAVWATVRLGHQCGDDLDPLEPIIPIGSEGSGGIDNIRLGKVGSTTIDPGGSGSINIWTGPAGAEVISGVSVIAYDWLQTGAWETEKVYVFDIDSKTYFISQQNDYAGIFSLGGTGFGGMHAITSGAAVNFDSEAHAGLSDSDHPNNRLEAAADGIYWVNATLNLEAATATANIMAYITVDGSAQGARGFGAVKVGETANVSFSALCRIDAGEFVQVKVNWAGAATLKASGGLHMHRVGYQ